MCESKKLSVLVVEDERLVRESIVVFLESLGYSIAGEAENGIEGLKKVKELEPDLVIMDIKMPEMDGIEAAKRIQETRTTPVVLLTAYESDDMITQASEAGVVSYLMKPPTAPDIHRAISIAMARHQDFVRLKRLNQELIDRTQELENAIQEIHILQGILPMCANCKKIRNDEGYWEKVENYIEKHSDVLFTHGFCPDCEQELYGDFLKKQPQKSKKDKK